MIEPPRDSADRTAAGDPRRRLEDIRRRIASADARRIDLTAEPARAAVAMILEPGGDDLHLFFIHRAVDERDRWSGQMAFPGGFHERTDADLAATVHREVLEEVGIDLRQSAEPLGRLDEIQGVARGRQLALVITPFLFALREPVEPKPNEEVQGVLWVPLAYFADPRNATEIDYPERPPSVRLPAFIYQGRTIWGLTLRMVKNFVERVAGA